MGLSVPRPTGMVFKTNLVWLRLFYKNLELLFNHFNQGVIFQTISERKTNVMYARLMKPSLKNKKSTVGEDLASDN